MLFSLSLLSGTIIEFIVILSIILFIGLVSRVIKRMAKTIVFSASFLVLIFIIDILVGYSILFSVIVCLRFVSVVSSSSIFFLTTSPDELELVMKTLHLPYDLIFAFVTAVRFVPVIMLDALQILDSQKSRGLEIEKGSMMKRIKNYLPVLVPLIVQSIIRSEELAEAMESRAYGFSKKKTSYYSLHLRKRDYLASVLCLIFIIQFIILVYFLHI
jgi:energy-coupling factor transport system permease protein